MTITIILSSEWPCEDLQKVLGKCADKEEKQTSRELSDRVPLARKRKTGGGIRSTSVGLKCNWIRQYIV